MSKRPHLALQDEDPQLVLKLKIFDSGCLAHIISIRVYEGLRRLSILSRHQYDFRYAVSSGWAGMMLYVSIPMLPLFLYRSTSSAAQPA